MAASSVKVGTLGALNTTVIIGTAGYSVVGIRLGGTWVGEVTFQGSVDGTTYSDFLTATTLAGTAGALGSTTIGQWTAMCAGLTSVRMLMSSYTSGVVAVYLLAVEVSVINVVTGGA